MAPQTSEGASSMFPASSTPFPVPDGAPKTTQPAEPNVAPTEPSLGAGSQPGIQTPQQQAPFQG
jgi:hypothetical protein